jgi:uncharacterized protein (DUF305 family)
LQSLPIHKEDFENTCKSELTDREYLEHMIPHHQVAIDMSKVLEKKQMGQIIKYINMIYFITFGSHDNYIKLSFYPIY